MTRSLWLTSISLSAPGMTLLFVRTWDDPPLCPHLGLPSFSLSKPGRAVPLFVRIWNGRPFLCPKLRRPSISLSAPGMAVLFFVRTCHGRPYECPHLGWSSISLYAPGMAPFLFVRAWDVRPFLFPHLGQLPENNVGTIENGIQNFNLCRKLTMTNYPKERRECLLEGTFIR